MSQLDEILAIFDRLTFLLIGGFLVVIAALVNRFAPQSRKHLRRTVVLYGLYLFFHGISILAIEAGSKIWGPRLHIGANLFEAFTLVAISGFVVFDLVLPKLKMAVVSITSDILVGIGYVVAAIGVAHEAGMNPSSVLATSAVVSAVLALSLQATLGNILGGVALQLDGSIHVGDWIQLEVGGRQGRVTAIRWRHTVLETRDWDTIIVPNALLLANNITILGKREGQPLQRRMWVNFAVDFRYSSDAVIAAVTEALNGPMPNVATEPRPHVVCTDLARDGHSSYALYAVRYWLTNIASDTQTDTMIRGRVHAALRRAGIPLARQAQTLFMTTDDSPDEKKQRLDQRRLDVVNTIELFSPLTEGERARVAERLRYAPFSSGETITRQGATAHWLYLLMRGKAQIRTRTEGVSQTVATLEAPAFFGEMGLLTGEARTADVVALTDVDCYRLDHEGFESILKDRPEIAQDISEAMAKRRVGLSAAREGLDVAAKRAREESEQERILAKIRDFFGLTR